MKSESEIAYNKRRAKTHLPYKSSQFFREIIEDVRKQREADRKPHAFGYIRVSKREQVQSGLSLTHQRQSCEEYWKKNLEPKGVVWGGFYADEAVSAYKKVLPTRPNGRRMLREMRMGDHLVILRPDRAFRNTLDLAATWEAIKKLKVTLHCTDLPCDPQTPEGECMMGVMVVFAQWESRIKSKRIKAAFAVMREQGRPTSGRVPWGLEVFTRNDGHKYFRVNRAELSIGENLVQYVKTLKKQGVVPPKLWEEAARFLNLGYPMHRGRKWTHHSAKGVCRSQRRIMAQLGLITDGEASDEQVAEAIRLEADSRGTNLPRIQPHGPGQKVNGSR